VGAERPAGGAEGGGLLDRDRDVEEEGIEAGQATGC
jgi:hypothetical protein